MITTRTFGTARARWTGIGPYYAMFPAEFCDRVVQKYTSVGDAVLDPFAGRGTAVFSAASLNRRALGIELNPVGWVYGKTKLKPAGKEALLHRLDVLGHLADEHTEEASLLPRFFHRCFHKDVRRFLLSARHNLDWQRDTVDRTLMSLILVNMHGKRHDSLSNQMRQTKAMAPKYAIQWWKDRGLYPPKVNPVAYLGKKIAWRYAKGVPKCLGSELLLGDSSQLLAQVSSSKWSNCALLLTSPPYFGITNYHYDQWLRLWLLGGRPNDVTVKDKYTGKFQNRNEYEELLNNVFDSAARLMRTKSTIYVRTDRRQPTYYLTVEALKSTFPKHSLTRRIMPYKTQTQTALFGHFAPKFGEIDLIMTRQ
jgi:DNA methylase